MSSTAINRQIQAWVVGYIAEDSMVVDSMVVDMVLGMVLHMVLGSKALDSKELGKARSNYRDHSSSLSA
jgi:hypothetical protein